MLWSCCCGQCRQGEEWVVLFPSLSIFPLVWCQLLSSEVVVPVSFELCKVLTLLCWRWAAFRWLLWWCRLIRCLVVCWFLLWIWREWAFLHLYIVWRIGSLSVWLQRMFGLQSGSGVVFRILLECCSLLKGLLNILSQCMCLFYDECGRYIHWTHSFDGLSCWWWSLLLSMHLPWWIWNDDFWISSLFIYNILAWVALSLHSLDYGFGKLRKAMSMTIIDILNTTKYF